MNVICSLVPTRNEIPSNCTMHMFSPTIVLIFASFCLFSFSFIYFIAEKCHSNFALFHYLPKPLSVERFFSIFFAVIELPRIISSPYVTNYFCNYKGFSKRSDANDVIDIA